MLSQGAGFARYSKTLCLVVSIIALLVGIVTFTSDSPNAIPSGFLWLVLSIVFAVTAIILGRSGQQGNVGTGEEQLTE